MYREFVRFKVSKNTKEAILIKTDINESNFIEIKNLFKKVKVLEPLDDGGFECILYFINEKHQEDSIKIEISKESLFSIIQTKGLKGNGIFEGNYAFEVYHNGSDLLNLEDNKNILSRQYADYLANRPSIQGRELKNTLGLNDLNQGHVYTKIAKGKLSNVHYLYSGKFPVNNKEGNIIIKPIYFDVFQMSHYFSGGISNHLGYTRYEEVSELFNYTKYVHYLTLESLSRWSICPNTSNKFNEDISVREPLDLSLWVRNYQPLLDYNDIKSLFVAEDSSSLIRKVGRSNLVVNSASLKVLLNKCNNNLYNKEQILYPLKNFKDAIKSNDYIDVIVKDIKNTTSMIEEYVSNYRHNENIRIHAIEEYSVDAESGLKLKTYKALIEYAYKVNVFIERYETLKDFNFDRLKLQKVISNNKEIILDLENYYK